MNIDLTNAGSVSIGEPHKYDYKAHQAQEIMLILVIADDQKIKI